MSAFAGKHILIIIENLPAPFDRRVWQEACTLKENGAEVSIICPKMKGFSKSYEKINNIDVYRHPLPFEGSGALGYFAEYFVALFYEFLLSIKIFLRKRFHVIQGCNPPDLIFLVALPFKLFGVKYVFDHHDINPELFEAKFDKKNIYYHLMVWFEKLTFKTANYSIATNESYKHIALDRGGMHENKVQIVRSGPSLKRLKIQPANPKYKNGKKYLIGYLGVIGKQEGLDLLLDSINHLKAHRNDFAVAIIGGGTELESIKQECKTMNLHDLVTFYGRVSDNILLDILNTCDVCVNPDVPTKMNNLSTMNKIMEYMALEKPIVQYDLKEGRASAQGASLYAKNTDTKDFAEKISKLLDDEVKRDEMGKYGRKRVIEKLSWDHESKRLIEFYKKILSIN